MSQFNFSIVIPTVGRKHFLNRLLKTIIEQEGVTFEVIVVHDSVRAEHLWLQSRYTKYDVFYHHAGDKKGANYCRNVGLDQASGEIVYFMDDDVYLPDNLFLYRTYLSFKDSTEPFIVGGFYKSPMGCTIPQFLYNCACNLWVEKNFQERKFVLLGGNFFAQRIALQKLRFDEEAKFGRDEAEIYRQWRLKYPKEIPILFDEFSIFHDSYLDWRSMAINSMRQQKAQPTTLETIEKYMSNPSNKIWLYLPTLIYILSGKIFRSFQKK